MYFKSFEKYKQEVLKNRRYFEKLLTKIKSSNNLEKQVLLAKKAIDIALHTGTGYYSSSVIENVFLKLAQNNIADNITADFEKNSFVHVFTETAAHGGHTRVVERWIEASDDSQKHSLIITGRQTINDIPNRLKSAVENKNGEIIFFDEWKSELEKAIELRKIASKYEFVILHIHMHDVLPIIAFGNEQFKRPVIFYNHADHLFWVGASISDKIADLREFGIDITKNKRGIDDSYNLGIPVDVKDISFISKKEAREKTNLPLDKKIIFTCGSAFKYKPLANMDFLDSVMPILEKDSNTILVGVGPTIEELESWSELSKKFQGRIYALGLMPHDKLYTYIQAADVVLDSFPMSGGTALIDAVTVNRPVVTRKNPVGQFDYILKTSAFCNDAAETTKKIETLLYDELKAQENINEIKEQLKKENSIENWAKKLPLLYKSVSKEHAIRSFKEKAAEVDDLDVYHYLTNFDFFNERFDIDDSFFKRIYSVNKKKNHTVLCIGGIKIKIKTKTNQSNDKKLNYLNYITDNYMNKQKSDFVKLSDKSYKYSKNTCKLLAFYLPQFHQFKENNEWHGRGFTEWSNVTSAIPHFEGHCQPHLPIDVGFYDLTHDDVMYRQLELAKQYGIQGFCFHYYWFSGKRLLERPIFNYLNNKKLDLPFCFCWANENWSKLWDGGNKEVLMEQKLLDGDGEKFFEDILPFFSDERYIKINNKPVLVFYKPQIFESNKLRIFVEAVRKKAKENGFDDIYFVMAKTNGVTGAPKDYYMDAMVEFPPHEMHNIKTSNNSCYINENFKGYVYDADTYVKNRDYLYKTDYPIFKTVFPNWDNTARKAYSRASIYQLEPKIYKEWLVNCIKWTKENHNKDEQFVFINAWNEWAEGAHLEPDTRYGYAYLQATKEALEETDNMSVNCSQKEINV